MQRLVSSYNPLFYALLVVLAVGLRWPQFTDGFLNNETALLLTAGQRIANGAPLYSETWLDQPPILPWLYAAVAWVSGDYALTVVRLLAGLGVFISAMLLLFVYQQYRMAQHGSGWIALVYVVAMSMPWYGLGLTREWLLVFLLVWIFFRLTISSESGAPRWTSLAGTGMLCGLCLCVDYRGILVLPTVVLMQLVLRPLRGNEIMTMLLGALSVVGAVLVTLLFQQALSDAFEVSFWGSWGRIWTTNPTAPLAHPVRGLLEAVLIWGILLGLALGGMATIRSRFFQLPIRVRKTNTLMFIWLGLGLAILLMGAGSWQVQHFVLVLPPLVFFAAYLLDHGIRPRWHLPVLLLLLTPAAYTLVLLHYAQNPIPRWAAGLDPSQRIPQMRRDLLGPASLPTLQAAVARLPAGATFWTSHPDYDLYLRLNRPCGLKYLDLAPTRRLLHTDPRTAGGWAFGRETLPETYQTVRQEAPAFVHDPDGVFARMRSHIPLLQQQYQGFACGDANCYRQIPPSSLADERPL